MHTTIVYALCYAAMYIFTFLAGVTIDSIYNLFSNNHLDSLFKPQWERFNVRRILADNEDQSITHVEDDPKSNTSECCAIV